MSCRLAPAVCVGEPPALGKGLGAHQAAAGIHHSRAGDASSPLKGFFRLKLPSLLSVMELTNVHLLFYLCTSHDKSQNKKSRRQ